MILRISILASYLVECALVLVVCCFCMIRLFYIIYIHMLNLFRLFIKWYILDVWGNSFNSSESSHYLILGTKGTLFAEENWSVFCSLAHSENHRRYLSTISQISRGYHFAPVQTCFLGYPCPYWAILAFRDHVLVLLSSVCLKHKILQRIRKGKPDQTSPLGLWEKGRISIVKFILSNSVMAWYERKKKNTTYE